MNRLAFACLVLPLLVSPVYAVEAAAPARILAPLMMQGPLTELEPLLRSRARAPLKIEYLPMLQLIERLDKGETADMVIVSSAAAQRLADRGVLKSQVDLAQSTVGIAVADGAPTPVLNTPDDVIAFLKATPSIAFYGAGGSGALVMQFAEKNGLADMVKQKATIISEGFTSTLVRDGKVASAVQQVSELKFGGATNIVPLPESMQNRSISRVIVFNSTGHPEVAARVSQALTSSEAAAVYRRAGLIPAF